MTLTLVEGPFERFQESGFRPLGESACKASCDWNLIWPVAWQGRRWESCLTELPSILSMPLFAGRVSN